MADQKTKVKVLIKNFQPKLDVFCGQEHKMREDRLKMLPYQLWHGVEFIMALALDGAIATRDPNVDSGKGGLLMAIKPIL